MFDMHSQFNKSNIQECHCLFIELSGVHRLEIKKGLIFDSDIFFNDQESIKVEEPVLKTF